MRLRTERGNEENYRQNERETDDQQEVALGYVFDKGMKTSGQADRRTFNFAELCEKKTLFIFNTFIGIFF